MATRCVDRQTTRHKPYRTRCAVQRRRQTLHGALGIAGKEKSGTPRATMRPTLYLPTSRSCATKMYNTVEHSNTGATEKTLALHGCSRKNVRRSTINARRHPNSQKYIQQEKDFTRAQSVSTPKASTRFDYRRSIVLPIFVMPDTDKRNGS